jgi:hypothetical protein
VEGFQVLRDSSGARAVTNSNMPTSFPELNQVLQDLVQSVQHALGANFVATLQFVCYIADTGNIFAQTHPDELEKTSRPRLPSTPDALPGRTYAVRYRAEPLR